MKNKIQKNSKKNDPNQRVLQSQSIANSRSDRVDALRGFAMLWMTVFHFCFDLNHFGFLNQNFYEDSLWTVQRSFIVSLFLFCAGLGQALGLAQGLSWSRFWNRWKQVAGAAVLVSVGSYFIYPESYIYFGVLHAIAVMLIIMRLTNGLQNGLWVLGTLIIGLNFLMPLLFSAVGPSLEVFNQPLLNWIGIINQKPRTEDYVPLIPWLGVMWLGLATGVVLMKNKKHIITDALPTKLQPLAVLGRYSLSYYLLHQPVLFGIVMFVKKLF